MDVGRLITPHSNHDFEAAFDGSVTGSFEALRDAGRPPMSSLYVSEVMARCVTGLPNAPTNSWISGDACMICSVMHARCGACSSKATCVNTAQPPARRIPLVDWAGRELARPRISFEAVIAEILGSDLRLVGNQTQKIWAVLT